VRTAELPWQRLGRTAGLPDLAAAPGRPGSSAADADLPTALNALVEAVSEAAELTGCATQHSPWLPPLGRCVLIDDLPQPDPGHSGGARLAPVAWALSDLPTSQAQLPVRLDLDSFGHLYVVGIPRSGRSQVLRTMAGSLARGHSSKDVHLYGVGFAGGALSAMGVLPHCGGVVPRGDIERLERLLGRLDTELECRQAELTMHHASNPAELREILPAAARPAHIVLFIDGWDALAEIVAEHNGGRQMDQLNRLLREGAASGLHVVATSERALLSGRATALNDNKLLLRLNDRADYHSVGKRPRDVPDLIRPGQGWTSDGAEIQVALLAPGAARPGPGRGPAPHRRRGGPPRRRTARGAQARPDRHPPVEGGLHRRVRQGARGTAPPDVGPAGPGR
jgi:S-DNA-T family DNA segregation ATPase FtsK/SpoIIIE